MSRSSYTVHYTKPFFQIEQTINKTLYDNGYSEYMLRGESVWKKGTGMLTAIHYIKIEYSEHEVTILGWIDNKIASFDLSLESKLTGYYGCIPKNAIKDVINQITILIQS